MKNYRIAASLFLVFGLLLTAMPASADPIGLRVRIENMTTGEAVIVTDNGALDGNGAVGLLLAAFGGASWSASSSETVGNEARLLFMNMAVNTAGDYQFTLINDGFDPGPDGPMVVHAQVDTNISGQAGSLGSAQSYVGLDNAVPALGADGEYPGAGAIPPAPDFTGLTAIYNPAATFGLGASQTVDSEMVVKSGPFSLVSTASVYMTGPGNIELTMQVAAVPIPEQSSLVLLSIGLLFILGTVYLRT